jgi:hypothetical protein
MLSSLAHQDALVIYLRIQMWLGVLSDARGALGEVYSLLTKDINSQSSPWYTAVLMTRIFCCTRRDDIVSV